MHMREQWWLHWTVSGDGKCHWVSMCTVWPSHSKWLSKWSNESASNFALSLNISLWKLFKWFRRAAVMGNWWLAALSRQYAHSCILSNAEVFLWNIKSPRWLSPSTAHYLAPCDFWLFPKLKSPLKGKRFQTVNEIQENMTGQLMAIRIAVGGPKVPTLKVTEASLSYVQCLL